MRELVPRDAEALFPLYSDFAWMKHSGIPVHFTADATRTMIARHGRMRQAGLQIRWGIERRDRNALIGCAGFSRFAPERWSAEISYELLRSASGHGYMTEALRAIVRFGFEHLSLRTINAVIDPSNWASFGVMERLGFMREGYLRENHAEGRFDDAILCTLTRSRPVLRALAR